MNTNDGLELQLRVAGQDCADLTSETTGSTTSTLELKESEPKDELDEVG